MEPEKNYIQQRILYRAKMNIRLGRRLLGHGYQQTEPYGGHHSIRNLSSQKVNDIKWLVKICIRLKKTYSLVLIYALKPIELLLQSFLRADESRPQLRRA